MRLPLTATSVLVQHIRASLEPARIEQLNAPSLPQKLDKEEVTGSDKNALAYYTAILIRPPKKFCRTGT